MDKNLLVQIFVPTTDPEGKGSIGTGYPVAHDRILTARHVVFPENRDSTRPIEVRWYHLNEAPREWQTVSQIVWDSQKEDVAVLECLFPPAIGQFAELDSGKPETFQKWESEGFAKAGKRDDNSNPPVGLKGEAYSMGGHGVFELGVDDPAKSPELWQGASGSPVFVLGKIQGIIVTTPTNFPANRFAAAPMWRLLLDPAFKSAINYQPKPLVKRSPLFLSSLVKTASQTKQINDLLAKIGSAKPSNSLSCVFADFTDECPDTLAFKLLHKLNSGNELYKSVNAVVDYKPSMKPEEWLWAVMKEYLLVEAPTSSVIQKALQENYEDVNVFVLNLTHSQMANCEFIAGLIQAWQSLKLDQAHCLVLLHDKSESPNLLRRLRCWSLRRWAERMGTLLGDSSHHLIRHDRSPAICKSYGKAWIKEIAGQDYSSIQTYELQLRWDQHFETSNRLRYKELRLALKADLIAVKA